MERARYGHFANRIGGGEFHPHFPLIELPDTFGLQLEFLSRMRYRVDR
jgi:hypothetical protein